MVAHLCSVKDLIALKKFLLRSDHGGFRELGTLMKQFLKRFSSSMPQSTATVSWYKGPCSAQLHPDWSLGLGYVGAAIAKSRSHFDIAFCGWV